MKIYKISVENKGLEEAPPVYFKKKKTAEAIINGFNSITAEGKKIEWKCEVIEVLSHQEAYELLEAMGKEMFD